jgi:hypothetical protein
MRLATSFVEPQDCRITIFLPASPVIIQERKAAADDHQKSVNIVILTLVHPKCILHRTMAALGILFDDQHERVRQQRTPSGVQPFKDIHVVEACSCSRILDYLD